MTTPTPRRLPALLLAALASVLAACGGGGYGGSDPGPTGPVSSYTATPLVSDQAGALRQEARLSNAWSLAFGGGSTLWLTNNGKAGSTLLSSFDPTIPALSIAVPPESAASARVTGAAFNPGNGFEVTIAQQTGVARFITASEGGVLSGWAPALGLEHAVVAFDGSATGAVYTGLAMTPQGVDSVLLAADFHNGVIDVFGPNFAKQPGAGRFVDPELPAGYAPFGISAQGALVYVVYAKPDASGHAPRAGTGLGMVNVFDDAGRLLQRLVSAGGALNAPWAAALAPAGFGVFGGALLVANAGDGTIAAFDATSGRALGVLRQPGGAPLVVDGLHTIAFGNGTAALPLGALFFTAGPQSGLHGLLGRIDLQ